MRRLCSDVCSPACFEGFANALLVCYLLALCNGGAHEHSIDSCSICSCVSTSSCPRLRCSPVRRSRQHLGRLQVHCCQPASRETRATTTCCIRIICGRVVAVVARHLVLLRSTTRCTSTAVLFPRRLLAKNISRVPAGPERQVFAEVYQCLSSVRRCRRGCFCNTLSVLGMLRQNLVLNRTFSGHEGVLTLGALMFVSDMCFCGGLCIWITRDTRPSATTHCDGLVRANYIQSSDQTCAVGCTVHVRTIGGFPESYGPRGLDCPEQEGLTRRYCKRGAYSHLSMDWTPARRWTNAYFVSAR